MFYIVIVRCLRHVFRIKFIGGMLKEKFQYPFAIDTDIYISITITNWIHWFEQNILASMNIFGVGGWHLEYFYFIPTISFQHLQMMSAHENTFLPNTISNTVLIFITVSYNQTKLKIYIFHSKFIEVQLITLHFWFVIYFLSSCCCCRCCLVMRCVKAYLAKLDG